MQAVHFQSQIFIIPIFVVLFIPFLFLGNRLNCNNNSTLVNGSCVENGTYNQSGMRPPSVPALPRFIHRGHDGRQNAAGDGAPQQA